MRAAAAPSAYTDPDADANTHRDTDDYHPDPDDYHPDGDSGEQDANRRQDLGDLDDRPATRNDHAERGRVEFERDEVRNPHQVGEPY